MTSLGESKQVAWAAAVAESKAGAGDETRDGRHALDRVVHGTYGTVVGGGNEGGGGGTERLRSTEIGGREKSGRTYLWLVDDACVPWFGGQERLARPPALQTLLGRDGRGSLCRRRGSIAARGGGHRPVGDANAECRGRVGGWKEQTGIIQAWAGGSGTPWGRQVYVGREEEEEGERKEARVGAAGEDDGRWGREQPTLVRCKTATSPEMPSLGKSWTPPIIPSGFCHPPAPRPKPLPAPPAHVLSSSETACSPPAHRQGRQRRPHTHSTTRVAPHAPCRESAHRSRSHFCTRTHR